MNSFTERKKYSKCNRTSLDWKLTNSAAVLPAKNKIKQCHTHTLLEKHPQPYNLFTSKTVTSFWFLLSVTSSTYTLLYKAGSDTGAHQLLLNKLTPFSLFFPRPLSPADLEHARFSIWLYLPLKKTSPCQHDPSSAGEHQHRNTAAYLGAFHSVVLPD